MTHATTHRIRGFTLVEVMVAMMVMAIIAVMAWQGVDGIVRTRTASQQKLEQVLRLNTVLAQFERDLDEIQDVGALNEKSPTFDGISLRLVRRTPTGLQIVVWSLRGGSWLRWAGPPLVTNNEMVALWTSSKQFIGNEEGQLRTLTGVADWQMYCNFGGDWSNCQSTGSPSTLMAIRMVLGFGPDSGFNGNVTREFAIGPQ